MDRKIPLMSTTRGIDKSILHIGVTEVLIRTRTEIGIPGNSFYCLSQLGN